jgi:hypothetical protein
VASNLVASSVPEPVIAGAAAQSRAGADKPGSNLPNI